MGEVGAVGGGGARSEAREEEPVGRAVPRTLHDPLRRARGDRRGDLGGWRARVRLQVRATTPATCGVAIDVPLIVFVAVSPDPHAEVIETPGANTSTQLPMFAHEAFVSVSSVALTVSAAPTLAGELLQGFAANPKMLPFPAAIA